MKNIYFIIISLLIFLASCSDCPICDAPKKCNVRDATITEFNPRLQKLNDTTLVPVPAYSIQTFQFPSDDNTSGVLTNDNRFSTTDKLTLADTVFNLGAGNRHSILADVYPLNPMMIGDIMVVSVDVANRTAILRFFGDLAKYPEDFQSEDADKFCTEFIPKYQGDSLKKITEKASKYGINLPNASRHNYTQNDITTYDDFGNIITETLPVTIISSLLNKATNNAIDVLVKPGEVYYYKARNGRTFAVLIADMNKGTFEPFKNRVTILFTAQ